MACWTTTYVRRGELPPPQAASRSALLSASLPQYRDRALDDIPAVLAFDVALRSAEQLRLQGVSDSKRTWRRIPKAFAIFHDWRDLGHPSHVRFVLLENLPVAYRTKVMEARTARVAAKRPSPTG